MDAALEEIGGYKIISRIASGGMGEVFKALDREGKEVALKVINPLYVSNEEAQERFVREIEVMKMLPRHPNMVQYYDTGEDNGRIFAVMEYVPGRNLGYYLKKTDERFDIGSIIRIMLDLLKALDHCHKHQVIHRDVKPDNVIFSEDGPVKLVDLGIVRAGSLPSITKSLYPIGTLPYMSPEQLRRPKDVDERSDIYSAGIMFYELLTGVNPFRNKTYEEVYELHNKTLDPPSQCRDGVAPSFDQVVGKATKFDRDERYQTVEEFANAINMAYDTLNIDPNISAEANKIKKIELQGERFLQKHLCGNNRFGVWLNSAQLGDMESQWLVGLCYHFGCGVSPNLIEASRWYRVAAENGHSGAQYRLALTFERQRGKINGNVDLTKEWYQRAADQDYALAQYRMGLREWGNTGDWNSERALRWFSLAADQRYVPALEAMANHYEHGWGVARDEDMAVRYYLDAARHGDARAQIKLALRHKNGKGVEKDDSRSLALTRNAAEQGEASAQFELGTRYRDGKGIKQDNEEARKWFQAAASKLYEPAKKELGEEAGDNETILSR